MWWVAGRAHLIDFESDVPSEDLTRHAGGWAEIIAARAACWLQAAAARAEGAAMHRSTSMASFAPLKRGPPPLSRAQQAPSDTAMGRARSHPRLDALAAERRQMLAEIDAKIAAAREAAAAAAAEEAQVAAAAATAAVEHVPQPYDPSSSDIDGAATCNRRAVCLHAHKTVSSSSSNLT
jgi:hypothetical protein